MGINARQLKAAIRSWESMSSVITVSPGTNGEESVTDFKGVVDSKDVKIDQLPGTDALVDIFDNISNKGDKK